MSLKPEPIGPVPQETVRVSCSANPPGLDRWTASADWVSRCALAQGSVERALGRRREPGASTLRMGLVPVASRSGACLSRVHKVGAGDGKASTIPAGATFTL